MCPSPHTVQFHFNLVIKLDMADADWADDIWSSSPLSVVFGCVCSPQCVWFLSWAGLLGAASGLAVLFGLRCPGSVCTECFAGRAKEWDSTLTLRPSHCLPSLPLPPPPCARRVSPPSSSLVSSSSHFLYILQFVASLNLLFFFFRPISRLHKIHLTGAGDAVVLAAAVVN